jgi:hypothetical protein
LSQRVISLEYSARLTCPATAVKLNGKPWHYFDDEHVFLPNARGQYQLEIEQGPPQSPRIVATFAAVDSTHWDDQTFTVNTQLPSWMHSVPAGYQFRMAIRWPKGELFDVTDADIQRQGSNPDSGGWVNLRFDPGEVSMQIKKRD